MIKTTKAIIVFLILFNQIILVNENIKFRDLHPDRSEFLKRM